LLHGTAVWVWYDIDIRMTLRHQAKRSDVLC
jgi:hypothetical protein